MNKVNVGNDLYLKGRIGWRGLSKDEYLDHSSYCIINATALLDNKINWNNCGYISKERFDESEEIILQEDDILISKDGTLGKIGFVKDKPENATVASGIFVLRNTKQDILDTTYLCHFLKSNIFKNFIKRNKADGSTINHLYQRDLARLDLDLPSLKEQQNIGYILSTIEEKIEANNKINEELESLAKTLYDYWFVQFDFPDENKRPYKSSGGKMIYHKELKREIPVGWSNCTLNDICEMYQPQTLQEDNLIDNGQFFVYGANGIIGKYSEYNHLESEIAIACRGNSCGVLNRTLPYSWITGNAMVIKLKDVEIHNEYLYHALNYTNIKGVITGSGQPQITRVNLAPVKIIKPNRDIVLKYCSLIKDNVELRLKNELENKSLINLRDFILPMLMNGQVTIQQ